MKELDFTPAFQKAVEKHLLKIQEAQKPRESQVPVYVAGVVTAFFLILVLRKIKNWGKPRHKPNHPCPICGGTWPDGRISTCHHCGYHDV